MTVTDAVVERLFLRLDAALNPYDRGLGISLHAIRPKEPNHVPWRYELRGFVRACIDGAFMPAYVMSDVDTALFVPKPNVERRTNLGREHRFIVNVTTRSLCSAPRSLDFRVAATNATDAYAQLCKRPTFQAIPDVETVEVIRDTETGRNSGPEIVFSGDTLTVTENALS